MFLKIIIKFTQFLLSQLYHKKADLEQLLTNVEKKSQENQSFWIAKRKRELAKTKTIRVTSL